jgi:hypothetical protein
LEPVLGELARDAGLTCRVQLDMKHPNIDWPEGKLPSQWLLMARTEAALGALAADARWQKAASREGTPVWTDAYSNLVGALRWEKGR